VRGGLTRRTIVASAMLALLVGSAFALLVRAIAEERDSARQATHSQEVLTAATALERLVLDLETGQRGLLITGDERFLRPWEEARAGYARAAEELVRITRGVPAQERRAREIAAAIDEYVRDFSIPLVSAARDGDPSAQSTELLSAERRQVDAIRARFDRFVSAERRLFAAREQRPATDARRAIVLAAAGLAGSVLLIALFGVYLTRAIVLPVRRAAQMADRLAGGDLATRMPETGAGEIGTLQRAFNSMAGSLEAGRDALAASRARVVASADEARRRIERDLHDGAQQRLIHTVITLKLAKRELGDERGPAAELVAEALEHAETATAELRELAHGILPAALSHGGLDAGVGTLVSRTPLPVTVDVPSERLPPRVEAAAYFIVAEALTNTVKHARASRAEVRAVVDEGELRVEIRDDGVGGATVDGSSGLLGLMDRAAAMDGELRVDSPAGRGTTITVRLPLSRDDDPPAGPPIE
jgi:signal transduction histidine kinase